MTRKSKPIPDDKEQSARFIETAGQVKMDNDKELFEKAISKVVRAKPKEKLKNGD